MVFGLVYSERDPAGKGIAEYILNSLKPDKIGDCKHATLCFRGENYYLAGFNEDIIYFEFLDRELPPIVESYIFLSRHSSAKKIKSYTVHHTGNFGDEAPYGGRPRTLSIANPPVTHKLLLILWKKASGHGRLGEYEVSYEATHHGPTDLKKPLTFIEIGSSLEEWREPLNHKVIGETIIDFLESPAHKCTPVVGVGGGHYPRKHTANAFEKGYCYGHIMAKYALPYLSEEILEAMVTRNSVSPVKIVVEKKGTRREHRDLISRFSQARSLPVEYV